MHPPDVVPGQSGLLTGIAQVSAARGDRTGSAGYRDRVSESAEQDPSDGPVEESSAPPTLESIRGTVPAADTGMGRYVRLFGWIVVVAIAAAIGWGAVTLISVVHRG